MGSSVDLTCKSGYDCVVYCAASRACQNGNILYCLCFLFDDVLFVQLPFGQMEQVH